MVPIFPCASPVKLPQMSFEGQLGFTFDQALARRIWRVADLVSAVRTTVERGYTDVWVEGEISNFRPAESGHLYFTLKDGDAQLRIVMFRSQARLLRFRPDNGMQIIARGRVTIYDARGELQLSAEFLEPVGAGALQLAFEQLKARLAEEGLFDPSRRKPIPPLPRRIGLVTSPRGAALHDMLNILARRHESVGILIYPAQVQGESAASEVAAGIKYFNRAGNVDVIIVARGGGSLEDLASFNDEKLARTISASAIPVISAVGHETDFTIADFVADLRAPTPSGAAELVVREKLAVIERLVDLYARLKQAMTADVTAQRERLQFLARRRVLTDPARALRDLYRRLDDLQGRLRLGLRAGQRQIRHRLALLTQALSARNPAARISADVALLGQLRGRLVSGAAHGVQASRARFATSVGRLESLSPLAVLSRGYSVTRLPSGALVRSAAQARAGDLLEILLHQGALGARVTEVRERDERHQV